MSSARTLRPFGSGAAQRDKNLVDDHHGHIADAAELVHFRTVRPLADDERRRAAACRVEDKAMAVGALAGKGEEGIALFDQARIDGAAANRPTRRAQQVTPDGRSERLRVEGRRTGRECAVSQGRPFSHATA